MPAVVLTLALTVIAAGIGWLAIGSRLRLSIDARQNDVLNFVAYVALALPIAFAIVYFGMR
jgi:hypothetical protein